MSSLSGEILAVKDRDCKDLSIPEVSSLVIILNMVSKHESYVKDLSILNIPLSSSYSALRDR